MFESDIEKIHQQGYRMTPQRLAILRILQEAGSHLTPITVFQRAQQEIPGLTEATVYRSLNFLTIRGLVLAAHVGNGQLVYEIAGHDHHHLICRECGQAMEIEHGLLSDLYELFKKHTGYYIDSIHTTFFGLCPACQDTGDKKSTLIKSE